MAVRVNKRVNNPFELVNSDVLGPYPLQSKLDFRYFVTFIDKYCSVTWLYLLHLLIIIITLGLLINRSEVLFAFNS